MVLSLKGHGNEADLADFLGPLHYLSSSSGFGFKFGEIFLIEKQLPDSESATLRLGESLTLRLGKSTTFRLTESESQRLPDSRSRRVTDLSSRGVVFPLRISPQIPSQNRNGSKCSVRDLRRTDLCKNPQKSASLPCPFKNLYLFIKNS